MKKTLTALLSREIPNVVAENLVAKKYTLVSLNKESDVGLAALGLLPKHISAIRDTARPPIPAKILDHVLEQTWRTCCVCHIPSRPIVVHHIVEWGKGGDHNENNLAVLCLNDHDAAHLTGGLSLRLSADKIRKAKTKWIARARKIRDYYEQKLTSADQRGARWYWIHVENLRAKITDASQLKAKLNENFLIELRENKFIDDKGNINSEGMWKENLVKPKKSYMFDSGDAQLMGIYVSDLFGQFLANSPIFDVTDMIPEKAALRSYLSTGSLVYFRHELEIKLESPFIKATINKTDVRVEFSFDPWTSLNQTAHGIHLLTDMAERSVVGHVSSMTTVGQQLRIIISPLGISPDFVLHDPSQGDWVKGVNNSEYRARKKKAKE